MGLCGFLFFANLYESNNLYVCLTSVIDKIKITEFSHREINVYDSESVSVSSVDINEK